jgi:hypothetical protein
MKGLKYVSYVYVYMYVYTYIHIYMYTHTSTHTHKDNIMKLTKHYLKKSGEKGGDYWNTIEGVNLFKAHCTHLWNYHNETPWFY